MFDVFITRLLTRRQAPASARRPKPARMTTPEERAPLYAAYAAARQYEHDNPGAEFTDDGIIQAAVNAYEKAKTGGTATTLRADAPGSVTVGGDNHGPISTSYRPAQPATAAVYDRLMHHHGPQTNAIVNTCRDLRAAMLEHLPADAADLAADMIDAYADGVITATEEA